MFPELFEQNMTLLKGRNSYILPHLKRIICLMSNLEKKAGAEFIDAFMRKEFRKGEYLLREGCICKNIWILENGLARIFNRKNGVELTKYFFTPAEFICDSCSSAQQIPSHNNIQVLQDSVAYIIRRDTWEELAKTYPVIFEIEKLILEGFNIWYDYRLDNIQRLCASEQYQFMLKDQAPLIKYLTITLIASYLNLPIQTVSRIRRELCVPISPLSTFR